MRRALGTVLKFGYAVYACSPHPNPSPSGRGWRIAPGEGWLRSKLRLFTQSAALLLAILFLNGAALAHKPSDSYLTLNVEGDTINGQWDIALRDLDFAIGLDRNQDGAITWGEVKAKHAEIAAY